MGFMCVYMKVDPIWYTNLSLSGCCGNKALEGGTLEIMVGDHHNVVKDVTIEFLDMLPIGAKVRVLRQRRIVK